MVTFVSETIIYLSFAICLLSTIPVLNVFQTFADIHVSVTIIASHCITIQWYCPKIPWPTGFIPQCNRWNHTCICVQRTGTCSGNDVSTCKITCNSQEKLYCDHGFCSCKSLDYCNQNNADCAIHTCSDLAEAPFCNVTQCQCASVVDTCNGPFMHQICSNGVCQCQLNPCEFLWCN